MLRIAEIEKKKEHIQLMMIMAPSKETIDSLNQSMAVYENELVRLRCEVTSPEPEIVDSQKIPNPGELFMALRGKAS